jgi:hypothetical protein
MPKSLIALSLALILGLSLAVFASPQVDTSQVPQHSGENQKSAADHAVSAVPIVSTNDSVAAKPNINATNNYANDEAPKHWWANPDWWVAIFTSLIVFVASVQAGLFVWQLRIANRTLILSNRPRIIVDSFRLHRNGETIQLPTIEMGIQYCIRNKGGTKATIIQNRAALLLGPIPNTLPYEETVQIGDISKLEAGEFRYCDYAGWNGPGSLFEQFEKVLRGQTDGAVLFGFVDFRDDAGGGDRVYFKRRWNPNTHAFERYKNSKKSN